jgi:hypothetical protein
VANKQDSFYKGVPIKVGFLLYRLGNSLLGKKCRETFRFTVRPFSVDGWKPLFVVHEMLVTKMILDNTFEVVACHNMEGMPQMDSHLHIIH